MSAKDYRQAFISPLQPARRRGRLPDLVDPREICVGCIIWIPDEKVLNDEVYCERGLHAEKDQQCNGARLAGGRFRHPAVVLEVRQREGSGVEGDLICLVSDMTSFKDSSLEWWFRYREILKFGAAVPIRFEQNPTVSVHQLDLHTHSQKLVTQSFVRVQHIWPIPVGKLHNFFFWGSHPYTLRLSRESYEHLMGLFGRQPQAYEEVDVVLRTAGQRLAMLARNHGEGGQGCFKRGRETRNGEGGDMRECFYQREEVKRPLNPRAAPFQPAFGDRNGY